MDCQVSDGMLKRLAGIQYRVLEAKTAVRQEAASNRISKVMAVCIWAINPTVATNPNQHTIPTAMTQTW